MVCCFLMFVLMSKPQSRLHQIKGDNETYISGLQEPHGDPWSPRLCKMFLDGQMPVNIPSRHDVMGVPMILEEQVLDFQRWPDVFLEFLKLNV